MSDGVGSVDQRPPPPPPPPPPPRVEPNVGAQGAQGTQQGPAPVAETRPAVEGAQLTGEVHAQTARLENAQRAIGGPSGLREPAMPSAEPARDPAPVDAPAVANADPAADPTANPARPAGQAPASNDLDTALRQTAHAGEAAREAARRAGVDPSQVRVTGTDWKTIDRRAAAIEADRAAGLTPQGWDGNPITPGQDARQVARDEVMSQRFGSRENWERVQESWRNTPQADRDAVAPANDPNKVDRARAIETVAMGFAGARAAAARPAARPTPQRPAAQPEVARPGVQPPTTTRPTAQTRVDARPETIAASPVRARDVVDDWNRYLGPGQTNIHPRTGQVDPTRIFSADGTRSIRYGQHEMGSNPNKAHYHRETWAHDPARDTMTVTNELVRIAR